VIVVVSWKERLQLFLSVFKISKESALKILSLTGILILAILIRLFPVIKTGQCLIRAYDPYIQYYSSIFIEEKGLYEFLTSYDVQGWYPWLRAWKSLYIGLPLIGAILHIIVSLFGIVTNVMTVASLVPVLFGTISVLFIFLIARELKGDNAGLFAAFLAAFSPGIIQRNIAGFYDNEAIALFLMLGAIWLYIRGERGSITSSIFSGVFLGLLGWSWGAYKYLIYAYALYVLILIFLGRLSHTSVLNYITSVVLGIGMMILVPRNYGLLKSADVITPLAIVFLVTIIELGRLFAVVTKSNPKEVYKKFGFISLIFVIVGTVFLFTTGMLSTIGGKFLSVINPILRESLPTFSSVSENQPSAWSVIFSGAFMAAILAPLGIYCLLERGGNEGIFFSLFLLTSYYFTSSIARFIVVGAAAMVIGAGIGIDFLLEPFALTLRGEWIVHHIRTIRERVGEAKLPRGEAVAAYALIGLILTMSVFHGIQSIEETAGYDISNDEYEVFQYLRTYADPSTVVLSWWDYGYRLRVLANVSVLVDNATTNSTQMGVVGSIFMLPEEKAVAIMKKYNVRYVVVYLVDLLKAIWMIKIAEKNAPMFGIKEAEYFDDTTGRYKVKFFQGLLWQLLAYGEDKRLVDSLIDRYGDEESRNQKELLDQISLKYIALSLRSSNDQVKLYEVIYRSGVSHMSINHVERDSEISVNINKSSYNRNILFLFFRGNINPLCSLVDIVSTDAPYIYH